MNQSDKNQATRKNIKDLIQTARRAQQEYRCFSQEHVDEVVTAIAWTVIQPEHNQLLSQMAIQDTGLGCLEDKITKNRRKTIGLLRDLTMAKSVGVIAECSDTGIIEIARPVGVVGALTPSTNPVATPTNMVMNCLKCCNAIVLSPSPKGHRTATKLVELFRKALQQVQAPINLIQILPEPISKEATHELMLHVDLVVATGSESNVRAAYRSGTPAIGVGKGNVPVIVDTSADLSDVASKIALSKTFDHATSCSAENSIVLIGDTYGTLISKLEEEGGVLLTPKEKGQLQNCLWNDGQLNRQIVARPVKKICEAAQLEREEIQVARFLLTEETGVGAQYPFSGEKLSPVLALYHVPDFDTAVKLVQRILAYQGMGHSCGIHTKNDQQVLRLGLEIPVCRVIVNQAHCLANGGNFDNGLPFTLSMGCGTWGGDSIHENLHYKHYMNVTKIVHTIPTNEPSEEELFGAYHTKYGK